MVIRSMDGWVPYQGRRVGDRLTLEMGRDKKTDALANPALSCHNTMFRRAISINTVKQR